MAVYSTQFILGDDDGHGNLNYTVPDGFVVVVRGVEGISTASSPDYLYASIDGQPAWAISPETEDAGSFVKFSWTGRVVLSAGQEILWTFPTGGGGLVMSGYLLSS